MLDGTEPGAVMIDDRTAPGEDTLDCKGGIRIAEALELNGVLRNLSLLECALEEKILAEVKRYGPKVSVLE